MTSEQETEENSKDREAFHTGWLAAKAEFERLEGLKATHSIMREPMGIAYRDKAFSLVIPVASSSSEQDIASLQQELQMPVEFRREDQPQA